MALDASKRRMRSGERVIGVDRVIERDRCPIRGCVAGVAGCGECRGNVIGVCCSSPVRLVAAIASGRQGGVVVVGVALGAGHGGMRASEREHGRVVEGRGGPGCCGVAEGAIGGESGGHMSGIGGAGKVCLVAAIAGGGQRCVVVVGVALRAGNGDVRAGEREGSVVVIEGGAGPRRCVVAGGASGWEAGRNMIWFVVPV